MAWQFRCQTDYVPCLRVVNGDEIDSREIRLSLHAPPMLRWIWWEDRGPTLHHWHLLVDEPTSPETQGFTYKPCLYGREEL